VTDAVAQVARLEVRGREEYLRICGSGRGTAILLIPPLFGEMNRCRRLLSDVMIDLAALGRGSALPDLPGTAESLTAMATVTLDDWRAMIAGSAALLRAATGLPPILAAFRGGAVLDDAADAVGRWRLMPVDGATILRDLARAQRMTAAPASAPPGFAGIPLDPALARPLASAVPLGQARVARLDEDPKAADARIAGSPLWRRAEPGRDRTMAAQIAEDIDRMAQTCALS
jgi:hypothetical protein